MKNALARMLAIALTGIALAGCATTSGGQGSGVVSDTPAASKPASASGGQAGRVVGKIPRHSKFAKIAIGMPMKQVTDLIGQPTDTKAYITGKSFIPFYFGSDGVRTEALYKGEGRITYAGGAGFGGGAYKVYRIIYDPNESGYAR